VICKLIEDPEESTLRRFGRMDGRKKGKDTSKAVEAAFILALGDVCVKINASPNGDSGAGECAS
jgi:hypothetical protein